MGGVWPCEPYVWTGRESLSRSTSLPALDVVRDCAGEGSRGSVPVTVEEVTCGVRGLGAVGFAVAAWATEELGPVLIEFPEDPAAFGD